MGGRYTVSLVVVHALSITWGYAVTAHTDVVSQTGTLLTSYPDVLAATVAGLLLVGVGVSSARAARRKLRYETWFYLHFYTYLAVALAFSHQFADGAEFVSNLPARVAWAAMYLAVALAIVWYRFGTPLVQGFRHQIRVHDVVTEAPGVVSVIVTGRNLERLGARSGQFFRWRFLTRELWWVSSPYSLSAAPSDTFLRITVKDLGDHSRQLSTLRPGTRVLTEGPYGAMTAGRRRRSKVLLIAGGVGITPLRALFQSIPARAGELTLIYRASSREEVVFADELQRLAAKRQATVHVIIGTRGELGGDPLSAAALQAGVPGLKEHDVYLCGPPGMTQAAVTSLRAAGVRRNQIHHESFEF